MNTFKTLALIFVFVCPSFVHGEESPLTPQPPAESAHDHGLNIIRVQLIPKDSPLPNVQKGSQNLKTKSEAITQCHKTHSACIAPEEPPLTSDELSKKHGCCFVDWINCLDKAGDPFRVSPDQYTENLENCYSQATPELQEQVLQQCNAGLDAAEQKLLDVWTPYHIKSNKTPALSYKKAQNCLDPAQHTCLSGTTGSFSLGSKARCCIAKNCGQLAKEVQYDEEQKCSGLPVKMACLASAAKKAKDAKAKCKAAFFCDLKEGVPLPNF